VMVRDWDTGTVGHWDTGTLGHWGNLWRPNREIKRRHRAGAGRHGSRGEVARGGVKMRGQSMGIGKGQVGRVSEAQMGEEGVGQEGRLVLFCPNTWKIFQSNRRELHMVRSSSYTCVCYVK
jgi:hypothetical protein